MPQGQAPSTARRVLIVEDEATISRGLADVLRYRGCVAEVAADGARGLALGLQRAWDLIVLDVMLPELNGFVVCERLRHAGCEAPILMLTAKGDEDDIVRGFEVGANDYVTKPFGVRELTARMDALLRRGPRVLDAAFQVGEMLVDPAQGAALDGENRIELTLLEMRVLRVLSHEIGRIVSRRALLRDAWEMSNAGAVETRAVDMQIAKLRKKLGRHAASIETVRGQGYRLCR